MVPGGCSVGGFLNDERSQRMSFRETTAWLAREERTEAERARTEGEERARAEVNAKRSLEEANTKRARVTAKAERPRVVDVNPYGGPPETWPQRAPDWYMAKYSFQKKHRQ
jgi:hypothetical protein